MMHQEAPTTDAGRRCISEDAKRIIQNAMIHHTETSADLPNQILDKFLFLGDADNANSLTQLRHLHITHVLNVTTYPELGVHDGIISLNLYIRDQEDENIGLLFAKAYAFIDDAKCSGGAVLVNCMAGRSRSASIVIAYLMSRENMSLADAFFFTQKKRPIVRPNIGFWQQLMREEEILFGKASHVPSCYAMFFKLGVRDTTQNTPAVFFRHYTTAYLNEGSASDLCQQVVQSWPDGMGGGGAVEAILLSCLEHLSDRARDAAVHFIHGLFLAGRFTEAEVVEGFLQLVQNADLEDMRVDIPRVDEYLKNIGTKVGSLNLISPAALDALGLQQR